MQAISPGGLLEGELDQLTTLRRIVGDRGGLREHRALHHTTLRLEGQRLHHHLPHLRQARRVVQDGGVADAVEHEGDDALHRRTTPRRLVHREDGAVDAAGLIGRHGPVGVLSPERDRRVRIGQGGQIGAQRDSVAPWNRLEAAGEEKTTQNQQHLLHHLSHSDQRETKLPRYHGYRASSITMVPGHSAAAEGEFSFDEDK